YLPRSKMENTIPSVAEKPIAFSGGTETILVVEDESAIREMIVRYLTRLAYTVLSAENGPVALEIWKTRKDTIDLLLTDMVMPGGMSGVQLASRIQLEKTIPIVYMSGYSEFIGVRGLDLKDGVNFIPKPFSLPAVAQAVRARLDEIKS
ncbi:MAG: response regulator, partial [Spirochaetia bacterium]|nr:response regulator [Spirochaetia bacterium]